MSFEDLYNLPCKYIGNIEPHLLSPGLYVTISYLGYLYHPGEMYASQGISILDVGDRPLMECNNKLFKHGSVLKVVPRKKSFCKSQSRSIKSILLSRCAVFFNSC